MNILFDEASKDDIKELIRLRIAYMIDDFGGISDYEKECMEKQLPDYFTRKLGNELLTVERAGIKYRPSWLYGQKTVNKCSLKSQRIIYIGQIWIRS